MRLILEQTGPTVSDGTSFSARFDLASSFSILTNILNIRV